jgi:molybdopterin-containing oxidoreductase family iron-sulfur binding subunit
MKIRRKTFLRLAWPPLAGLAKVFGAQTPRWGMAIDVQKCRKDEGCRLCMDACHSAHNVPSMPDPRRAVKWIWRERFAKLFPSDRLPDALQTATAPALCNHCENPPCTRVCPTGATFKRADGLVVMDEHRCIGCRYCMAACPYGSRSFNWSDPAPHVKKINAAYPCRTKGVVEKCTFCPERLAAGLPPLCVAACKERALVFGDLNDAQSEIRKLLGARYALRRRAELGTGPGVFYVL